MIYVDGKELVYSTFPNGEICIPISQFNSNKSHYLIDLKYENDSDLIKLMFVKNHIDKVEGKQVRLLISYLPYSRMDRSKNTYVFTLKYICELINSLNFYKVTVIEAHSDVSEALLNRCENILIADKLVDLVQRDKSNISGRSTLIVFPDAGAEKRYTETFKDYTGWNKISATKNRDFTTGKITSIKINAVPEGTYKNAIIVDDLCSYGGTFIGVAEELKKHGIENVYLCVTHCEKSIFEGKIFKEGSPITKVYTTDSIINESNVLGNDKIRLYKGEY